jgi:hypothetical protein
VKNLLSEPILTIQLICLQNLPQFLTLLNLYDEHLFTSILTVYDKKSFKKFKNEPLVLQQLIKIE